MSLYYNWTPVTGTRKMEPCYTCGFTRDEDCPVEDPRPRQTYYGNCPSCRPKQTWPEEVGNSEACSRCALQAKCMTLKVL